MKNKINLISSVNDLNQDIRSKTAHDILDKYKGKQILLYKTTRAGGTTSLSSASIDRGDTFLIIVPNNMIAETTIIEDVKKYCNHPNPKIVHVKSNRYCKYNQELYEKYPALDRLPFLPKAKKCDECEHFYSCPVTEILRCKKPHGIVITRDKLVALMKASSGNSNTLLNNVLEILLSVDNVIFDEVHTLQDGKKVSIPIYNEASNTKWINLNKYDGLKNTYKHVPKLIHHFSSLLDDREIGVTIHELKGLVEASESKKQNNEFDDLSNHNPVKIIDNKHLIVNSAEYRKDFFTKAYREIIKLLKSHKNERSKDVDEIIDLEKILAIMTSKRLSVQVAKDKGYLKANVAAIDEEYLPKIQQFISKLLNKEKTIILTSATICSFDYDELVYGLEKYRSLERVMFGPNGDPLCSNSRMLILADNKRFHDRGDRSTHRNFDEISSRIVQILDYWGDENCMIVAKNSSLAMDIKKALMNANHPHDVTYYKASNMMGVTSNARIMIAVELAYKPSHAYDLVTSDKASSKILKEESVQSDTWQAISRAKDPNGKEPSVVFALGSSIKDCQYIAKWGFDRKVQIGLSLNGQGRNIQVDCMGRQVSPPEIVKCKNFDEMMQKAAFHTNNKKVLSDFGPKPLLLLYNNINISGLNYITNTILNKCGVVDLLVANNKYHYKQSDISTTKKYACKISSEDIASHIHGNLSLSTYSLFNVNEVKWVCFTIKDSLSVGDEEFSLKHYHKLGDVYKIISFLNVYQIPFSIERSHGLASFRIWIFLKPVKAKIAKELGKWILKEIGVKCNMFPKKTEVKRTGPGEVVPLPFGANPEHGTQSEFLINGSFTPDFETVQVGIMDLLMFNEFKSEQYANISKNITFNSENVVKSFSTSV